LREKPQAQLSARLRQFLEDGAKVSPERLRSAHEQAERARRAIAAIFQDVDALVTPAAVGEAPLGLDATGDPVFSRIWTLLGTPCVSLPVLSGPAGLPLGLQVVGPISGEARLLGASAWIVGEMKP
jgi:Asp-tRNA(Asn)/Glu-tRNA(Gln) amidotransferase A subunit family amidase